MTMPHLMNCSHSEDGWCLACVKELNDEAEDYANRAHAAEDALRSIACFLSVGGYNAPTVDAALFEKKIREGIDAILRVELAEANQMKSDLRDAIRLIIGRERGISWNEVNQRHVDGYIDAIRSIKEATVS